MVTEAPDPDVLSFGLCCQGLSGPIGGCQLPGYMRVLIVDEELSLVLAMTQAFRAEGFAVDSAVAGDDGLAKALGVDYDAIILNVRLPRLDGWQVLRRLRGKKPTPVLMLMARGSSRDCILGLDSGADDFLVKPVDIEEVIARIRALIRRAAGEARTRIELGPVALDLRAGVVLRGEDPVLLTQREYAILEYLALHRGRLVTRTTLYEHLFDERDTSLSNLVDVHISKLRKKLGADLISTQRGRGYCIERNRGDAPEDHGGVNRAAHAAAPAGSVTSQRSNATRSDSTRALAS